MIDPALSFSTRLAQQIGQFLLDRFKLSGIQGQLKADQSVVTAMDLEADRLIAAEIHMNYPEEGLISEEIQPVFASKSSFVWIIDPLDGTTNYSLGLPHWGVSIARFRDGWPELGVVYFPVLNELYVARLKEGSTLNGEKLWIDEAIFQKPITFFSCCSRTLRGYDLNVPYKFRILGSGAYSFCSLARGASILSFEATAKIWDIAAAWLVVSEAGGVIEPHSPEFPFPLIYGMDYSQQNFPILAAATPEVMAKARRWIHPKETALGKKS